MCTEKTKGGGAAHTNYSGENIASELCTSNTLEKKNGGRESGGGVLIIMHGRSRTIIDPRIPTMPGRSTTGFNRPGRHR